MQLGLERILREGGYGAYSTHFDAIADDGRFARLPLAAASSLMAAGYGYAAEGDAMTAALMSAAQTLLGTTQFTEMYAMDFARDAFLMSHMGEGNWALARADRPVRLIKRSLGIGGLDDPPTFLFQYETGPVHARVAARPPRRSASGSSSSEGEILDTDELPGLEMPYGFFRPATGVAGVRRRLAARGRARTTRSSTRATGRATGARSARRPASSSSSSSPGVRYQPWPLLEPGRREALERGDDLPLGQPCAPP